MTPREALLMIEAKREIADKKLRRYVAMLSAEIRNSAGKIYKREQRARDIDPEAFLPWDYLGD